MQDLQLVPLLHHHLDNCLLFVGMGGGGVKETCGNGGMVEDPDLLLPGKEEWVEEGGRQEWDRRQDKKKEAKQQEVESLPKSG